MGNIFKGCSYEEDIYKETNLTEKYKPYTTSKGPPVFTDDTFTTNYPCIRCPEELC
tara:strand:- start:2179 stop:2346 length:168 start_codon:yes stop_codon:yes gene_type:complete